MLNRNIIQTKWLTLLLLTTFFLTAFSIISMEFFSEGGKNGDSELTRFRSDFKKEKSGKNLLYKQNLSRKKLFIAYSSYINIKPGKYDFRFLFSQEKEGQLSCRIEIASEKGKIVEASRNTIVGRRTFSKSLSIETRESKEVEPRVIFRNGNKNIRLLKVSVKKVKNYLNWNNILFKSTYLSLIIFSALLSLIFAYFNDIRWRHTIAFFLTLSGISLIIKYAWISEDALITMRHIDNFIAGHGAVFNIGERVEGYSHTLWFYLVSAMRYLGLSPKGSVILPGLIFSSVFLYLLFFGFRRKKGNVPYLNFAGAVLIGMSSFIDFGTSGLESSLSYLLLILLSLQIFKNGWKNNPVLFGLTVSFLTLNRPDFGIFLIFFIFVYIFFIFKKEIDLITLIKFFIFPFLLLFGYEIFRMGYYGSMFPNPFYAKSGSASYFSQGFLYIFDLIKGSAFILIIIFAVSLFFIREKGEKEEFRARAMIFSAGLFYTFFIVRGGGDFMHGRFLLPSVILISISSAGIFDNFFSEGKIKQISAVLLIFVLLIISHSIVPLQKRGSEQYINGISDERYTFYRNRILPLDKLFTDDLIFMWKTIGRNYSDLSKRSKKKLKIAYHTVGFLGYYSGNRVHVIDRLGLTDPVIARQKIEKRGRPGHEKSAPFGYLTYRRLTFGDTPYKVWNKLAETKYGTLWDISRQTLNRFSFFINKDFKEKLDSGILLFLEGIGPDNVNMESDFLYFLKIFWYPSAMEEHRIVFDRKYDRALVEKNSTTFRWIEENRKKIEEWDLIIKGKITLKKFFNNIIFALKNI